MLREAGMTGYFKTDDWLDSFIAAVKGVVTSPGAFFEGMPKADAWTAPVLFFTLTLAPTLLIGGLATLGFGLLLAPVVWAFALAGTWLWAWYLGWAVRTFVKGELDTLNAFQICAYSNTPMLIGWLPFVGQLLWVWSLALQWIGLTRKVGVSSGAALLILVVPAVIVALSLGALFVALTAYLAQSGISLPMDGMMQM
ncbi:MAG: YIP1 family protein [Mariprofundaceae bacterium]